MSSPHSIVIVGAGAAGIGAARKLVEVGLSPIILEARDRVGGRVCSHVLSQNLLPENNTTTTITVQLGANWIHILDDSNPLFKVVNELKLSLQVTSSDSEPGDDTILFDSTQICPSSGNYLRVSNQDYVEACRRYQWIGEHFESIIGPNKQLDVAFESMVEASKAVFGELSDAQRRCFNWFFDRIAIDLASPLNVSASDNYLEPDTAGSTGEALIEGGYYQVIHHLAHEYKLNIQYNHEVTSLHYSDSDDNNKKVKIKCQNGDVFQCDYCIVTLPIGVLHADDVHFEPTIPSQIQSVGSEVVPGLMNVVWLWYPAIFWPLDCNYIGITQIKNEIVEFGNFLIPKVKDNNGNLQPILMCQLFGEFAIASESMTEQEVAIKATNTLRKVFGVDNVPDAIGCAKSTWLSEKFTKGSWAHVPFPYQNKVDNESVDANSIDSCVFYAGEAGNYDHRGTVHGAYMSGIEEATKIIAKCVV